jgi:ABC-type glycerol-3-phosphate transport system substrate-binding protein
MAALLRGHVRGWEGRQQARVEVIAYALDKGPEAVSGPDIVILPPAWMPGRAHHGRLEPVPEAIHGRSGVFDWSRLLPHLREQLLVWDKTPFAVPIVGEAFVCLYRADLFASPEYQKKFLDWHDNRLATTKESPCEFRPPASWQELATLAEFFREHHPKGTPGPSLPALPVDPLAMDRLFYQVASSFVRRAINQDEVQGPDHLDEVFSFHYDLNTGQPRIASAGFVATLELLSRLQTCRPAGMSEQPEKAFLDGEALFALTSASWLVEAQKRPALRDRVGVAPIPGSQVYFTPKGVQKKLKAGVNRIPYLGSGGWLGVVPASTANADAAWDLLADLAGPARSSQLVLEPRGAGPTRTEHVLRDRWDAFDLTIPRALGLKDVIARTQLQHGLKNPVVCLRTPDEATHREALLKGLRRVLLDQGSPAEALNQVSAQWKQMDEKRGLDRHRTVYRISLGLSGK